MPIFDQGYQHWSGQLSGHAWRWLAITRHGVRNALAKPARAAVSLLVAWLPALVLVGRALHVGARGAAVRPGRRRSSRCSRRFSAGRSSPARATIASKSGRSASTIFLPWELWFSMVLVLLVGPNLISQDLRYNALPLYFSRPLRRIDYFLGKLGVIVALLGHGDHRAGDHRLRAGAACSASTLRSCATRSAFCSAASLTGW